MRVSGCAPVPLPTRDLYSAVLELSLFFPSSADPPQQSVGRGVPWWPLPAHSAERWRGSAVMCVNSAGKGLRLGLHNHSWRAGATLSTPGESEAVLMDLGVYG